MRYLLASLALLTTTSLPAFAVNSNRSSQCQTGQQVAQTRCYEVAAWVSPDMMRCEQVGQTQLGIPIWRCC